MAAKLTPEILGKAQKLKDRGISVREAAERLGVGKTQLASALAALATTSAAPKSPPARRPVPPAPPSPPGATSEHLTPLALARGMLDDITAALSTLDRESSAYARLESEKRQRVKLIAALEAEAAGDETAEELERRRRRESGETRKEITRYVAQALAVALRPSPGAPHGKCPTCSTALSPEGLAALTGAP